MKIMSDDVESSDKADKRQKENRIYITILATIVLLNSAAIVYLGLNL